MNLDLLCLHVATSLVEVHQSQILSVIHSYDVLYQGPQDTTICYGTYSDELFVRSINEELQKKRLSFSIRIKMAC